MAQNCCAKKVAANLASQADTVKKDKLKKQHGCTAIANLTGNTCIGSILTTTAAAPIASVEWIYEDPATHVKSSLIKQTGVGPFTYKADVAGGYITDIITTAGCEVNSNAITVTNVKEPLIVISTKSNVVCAEFPAPVFTAIPTYNGEFPQYQWKVNDVNSGPATARLSSFSLPGLKKGDKITCEMTSSDDCITQATVESNPIFIDDVPVDKPSVTIVLTTQKPCSGASLSFAALTATAGDAPKYQWYVNDNLIPNSTDSIYTSALLKDGDQLLCKVTGNAQVCQVTKLAESLPYTVKTIPLLTPTISVVASATTVDAGTPVTFIPSAQNTGPHPVYQWMINGIQVASGDKFTPADLNNGDQVSCTLISDADCTTDNTVPSLPVIIHINATVQVITPSTFTPNGDGINDTWQISGIPANTIIKVKIYNRYGQPVYQSNGYANAWSGNTNAGCTCASCVYYYFISLGDKPAISGSVTILR